MLKKILIVEDDKSCSDMYKMRFEMNKWEVTVAYSPEHALTVLKSDYNPDAILLDLMFRGMKGDEFLHLIRKEPKTKDTIVVVLTAMNFIEPTKQEEINKEADDYIFKISIMPKELVERVEELVEGKSIAKSQPKTD